MGSESGQPVVLFDGSGPLACAQPICDTVCHIHLFSRAGSSEILSQFSCFTCLSYQYLAKAAKGMTRLLSFQEFYILLTHFTQKCSHYNMLCYNKLQSAPGPCISIQSQKHSCCCFYILQFYWFI